MEAGITDKIVSHGAEMERSVIISSVLGFVSLIRTNGGRPTRNFLHRLQGI